MKAENKWKYLIEHPEIKFLLSANIEYQLLPDQCVMETKRAWEIWDMNPLPRRLKRLSKDSILWIGEY